MISIAPEGAAGAAVCAALPGLQAQMWWRNPGTGMCTGVLRWDEGPLTMWQVGQARVAAVDGLMRWSMYEAISAGTETTELLVARVSLAAVRAARASGGSGAWLSCPVCARE